MKNNRLVRVFLSVILCTAFLAIPTGNVYAMPFKAAVNYAAGTTPYSVAVGDFNGDGKPDLAVANSYSNDISIKIGTGDGTFTTAASPAAGTTAHSVAVGDFDGNGKVDLAVANYNDNNVSILLGNGNGTFTPAASPAAGTRPISIAISDFNRDGKPDLAVANYSSYDVSILLGAGDGTFTPAASPAVGQNPYSVAVGDFNRDGKPDLAVANASDGDISILLGNGNGTFTGAASPTVGIWPRSVTVGDFNRDGKPDLAVANFIDNNISILLGNGLGGFAAAVNYAAGSYPISIAVCDFNRDNKLDLAVANYSSNDVSILLGDGLGTFTAFVNYVAGTGPESVATGDFNGDGAPDLAVANSEDNNVSILLNKTAAPSVSFNATVNYDAVPYFRSVATGDFNRDGILDLAAGYFDGAVYVLSGKSDGTFGAPSIYSVPSYVQSVATGDFNLDGWLDIATAHLDNSISVLINNGSGGFGTASNYSVGAEPFCVAVGDFNLDGKPDLVVANHGSNNVSILTDNASGGFAAAVNYTVGTHPYSVAVGDFNLDGKPDLATANSNSANVSILLGKGDGTFQAKTDKAVGSAPRFIAVGDFDLDGKLDLAVADSTDNKVYILLGDGSGGFGSAVGYSAGSAPISVTVADFNIDGKPDLAVADYYGNVCVLINDGSGSFATKLDCSTGGDTWSAVVGDFNRDGRPDLAAAVSAAAHVSILINTPLAGNVFTWGSNEGGELGDNTTTGRNIPGRVHGTGDSGYLDSVTAIAGGFDHCLAVKSDGTVWAWGYNRDGQLGDGTNSDSYTPVQVHGVGGSGYLSGITSVSARGKMDSSPPGIHSLACGSNGKVYAWGANGYGQLGNGTTDYSNVPIEVPGLTNVTAVAAGCVHSLALKSDGTVWAWGYNELYELGDSTGINRNTPVQVHGVGDSGYLTNIIAIAAGYYHSLAVKSDGTVYAWGYNASGELGNGTDGPITGSSTPVQVSGLTDAVAVAGGGDRVLGRHSLAVKSDGTVWAWGYNGYGQLGNNSTGNRNVPVQVHGLNDSGFLSGVKSVAAGALHSIAVKFDGTAWAWGDNAYGELGNCTNTNSSTPVQVTDMSNVVAISAGALDGLALIGFRPFAPTVATNDATGVTSTTAQFNGRLTDDGGEPCQYHFRYGTSPGNCTNSTTWIHSENKTTGQTFYDICGLSAGTTYYYVAECRNDNGALIGTGLEKTFTTLSGPTVTTGPATSVMATTAILHGTLTGTGGADNTTIAIFSGTSDGGTTPGSWARSDNLSITAAGPFSLGVTGLLPNQTYYYRCYATNTAGHTWAPDPSVHFTTQANLGLWKNYWAGPGTDWHWFSSGGL